MNESKVQMYLYIIDAMGIPSKDMDSLSDPYIVVKTGDK